MKLKFFFFILSLLLVAVWGVLLVLSFKERGMLFYMVEGIITFSLIFLIFFYRKVIKRFSRFLVGIIFIIREV